MFSFSIYYVSLLNNKQIHPFKCLQFDVVVESIINNRYCKMPQKLHIE